MNIKSIQKLTTGFAVAVSALLSGCGTTSGLEPTVERSGFDQSSVVTIAPHGGGCTRYVCTGIGAQWTSARPDSAIVIVRVFNEYKAITGAKLSVDGSIIDLKPLALPTNFENPAGSITQSTKSFSSNLADIQRVAASKNAWLRVMTTDGYIEDPIVNGSEDSKAFHALKRFLLAVENTKQAQK